MSAHARNGRPNGLPFLLQIGMEESFTGYLPDFAGAEMGADLELSSTECEPPEVR